MMKDSNIFDVLARFPSLPDDAFVRLPVTSALFGISNATAWRWVKSGILPAPLKPSPKITCWRVGDLRDTMQRMRGGQHG